MNADDVAKLKVKLRDEVIGRASETKVAIVGLTPAAIELAADPLFSMGGALLSGIFATRKPTMLPSIRPLDDLATERPDIILIADDAGKESLLEAVAALVPAETKLLIGGFSHFTFRDDIFDRVLRDPFIPSLANGYQYCLVHLYQCLQNAHRQRLKGVVAEFGMFKGGTTLLLSKFIEEIGADWKIFGFDTFDGFPPKRSALDMYAHPDCVFRDVDLVKAVFAGRNVEVVEGDVVQTVSQLRDQNLVLSFVDTDNYSSASAIIRVIADRTVVGGAIVFDHWTGHDRHLDTIGERIAAKALAADERYFNLHGTGVFSRQR
jgi:O-methyltransferase